MAAGVAVAVLVSVYERDIDGVDDFVAVNEEVGVEEGSINGWKEGMVAKDGSGIGEREASLTAAEGVEDGRNVGEGSVPEFGGATELNALENTGLAEILTTGPLMGLVINE